MLSRALNAVWEACLRVDNPPATEHVVVVVGGGVLQILHGPQSRDERDFRRTYLRVSTCISPLTT